MRSLFLLVVLLCMVALIEAADTNTHPILESLGIDLNEDSDSSHPHARREAGQLVPSKKKTQGTPKKPKGNPKEDKREPQWLNITEANKKIKEVIKQKCGNKNILKKKSKLNKTQKKQKICQSIAMLRCGCTSLESYKNAYKNASQLGTKLHFKEMCIIRKQFFTCLDDALKKLTESGNSCRHPNNKILKQKKAYQKHMKEIVKVLTTTKECIWRTDNPGRDLVQLKINSDFCSVFSSDLGDSRSVVNRRAPKKKQKPTPNS